MYEAGEPNMLVDLSDSDLLPREDLAEVDLLAVEADSTAGGDDDGLVVEGVFELGQALIGP
jgi:hypothetical protein